MQVLDYINVTENYFIQIQRFDFPSVNSFITLESFPQVLDLLL